MWLIILKPNDSLPSMYLWIFAPEKENSQNKRELKRL